MFSGPDAQLVQDAFIIAGLAAAAGMGLVFGFSRLRKSRKSADAKPAKSDLEERVQVLERIATDRSIDLADEIEALRDMKKEPA